MRETPLRHKMVTGPVGAKRKNSELTRKVRTEPRQTWMVCNLWQYYAHATQRQ